MLYAVVLSLVWLQAQPAPAPAQRPSALIIGRVIDAGSGKPISGVIVGITGAALPRAPMPPRLMTDAQGRFIFRNLPAGSYGLTAVKPGYIDGAYGRRRQDGGSQQLELSGGERATDVAIVLWKYGAITGQVVDEAGQPIVGAQIRALQRRAVDGRLSYRPTGVSIGTDDRGVYRVANLPPADYLITVVALSVSVPTSVMDAYRNAGGFNDPAARELSSAIFSFGTSIPTGGSGITREGDHVVALPRGLALPNGEGAPSAVYPQTLYPGVTAAPQATIVRLRSGEEKSGIDIPMRPVPAVTITGSVTRADGPAANVAVRLESPGTHGLLGEGGHGAVTDGNGHFTMLNVPTGSYTLVVNRVPPSPLSADRTTTVIQSGGSTIMSMSSSGANARTVVPAEPTWWASMPLSVGRTDISGVQVALQQGARFTGRIEFDGTSPPPDTDRLTRLALYAWPADETTLSGNRPAQVENDGSFRTIGVPGGRYVLRVMSPVPGWTLKSALYEGRDVADVPIDVTGTDINGIVVTFTDRPAEISGTVRRAEGGDPDATVLVFPSEPALWNGGANARRMRSSRAAKTGAYTVNGLPPGSYYVVAVPDELASNWTDRDALEAFARDAILIDVSEGAKKTVDLRTVRAGGR